jgi:hypothetical protein
LPLLLALLLLVAMLLLVASWLLARCDTLEALGSVR